MFNNRRHGAAQYCRFISVVETVRVMADIDGQDLCCSRQYYSPIDGVGWLITREQLRHFGTL